jgi:hypothetical protein
VSTKHTPGPWYVFIDDTGGQWTGWPVSIGCSDEDKSIVRPGGFYLYAWDAATSQREAVANAHLMAATPDLLEACASVWAALAGHDDPAINAVAMECRAAIAKATGEDQ